MAFLPISHRLQTAGHLLHYCIEQRRKTVKTISQQSALYQIPLLTFNSQVKSTYSNVFSIHTLVLIGGLVGNLLVCIFSIDLNSKAGNKRMRIEFRAAGQFSCPAPNKLISQENVYLLPFFSFLGTLVQNLPCHFCADLQLWTGQCYFDANGAGFLMNPCLFCRCFESWLCLFPSSAYLLSSAFASFQGHVILCLVFWSYLSSLPIEKKITFFSRHHRTILSCLSAKKKSWGVETTLLSCVEVHQDLSSREQVSLNQLCSALSRGQDGWHRKQNSADGTECQRCNRFFFHTLSRPQISPWRRKVALV